MDIVSLKMIKQWKWLSTELLKLLLFLTFKSQFCSFILNLSMTGHLLIFLTINMLYILPNKDKQDEC